MPYRHHPVASRPRSHLARRSLAPGPNWYRRVLTDLSRRSRRPCARPETRSDDGWGHVMVRVVSMPASLWPTIAQMTV